jgi:two-component system, OmpR family, alkaline phosphatase synthesis response regulator PhoP
VRILLVENDLFLARLLCNNLQSESYSVDTATTGEEGLKLVKAVPYDLMILDIGLAGKDGLAACQNLHQINTSIPILLLSERCTREDKGQWFESGADGYMTKPFSLRELSVRVRALLRYKSEEH